jgi:hypothetical protein
VTLVRGGMSVDDLAARACEEVQTLGRLDEACVKLLCALMAEETRRVAVLRPPGGWDRDEVEGLVSEFFIKKGQRLTADLAMIGVTPEVVGKVMRRWIRNFLIDRARDTPLGRIRRKLEEDMLGQYPELLQVPPGEEGAGRWYLAGQPSYPYGGDFTPLIEAAYAVPGVKAVRWSGPRRPPLTSDASLRAIVAAVLTAAGGSLEVAQLVHVVAQRFPAAAEPEDVTIDDDTFDRVMRMESDDPGFAFETGESISAVLDQLSPSQRALVPYLDRDINAVMEVLNVGRSRAYEAVRHLKDVLDRVLPDNETRAVVWTAVVERCSET